MILLSLMTLITLTELWQEVDSFLEQKLFELNQTPVTIWSILVFLIVLFGVWFVSQVVNKFFIKRLLMRFNIDPSTRYNMVRISHYLFMVIGTLGAFQIVGISLSGLAVLAGFLSVGIGFGLQNVTSNFVSGLILLFERPISVGDRVTVGDTEGDVKAINMRATTIQTLNNISIIVPNSEFISQQVVNWSHGDRKIRLDLTVGVSYGSDLEKVLRALQEVAEEHSKVLRAPQPDVLLEEFGDSSWNMKLRVWLPDPVGIYVVRSEINCAIVNKFRENGIEIPFPQRDLHVRSPLPVPLVQEVAS